MDKPRTILFLNYLFPDPRDGGVETVIHTITAELFRRGYRSLCIYYHKPPEGTDVSGSPFCEHAWLGDIPDSDIVAYAVNNDVDVVISNCILNDVYTPELLERLRKDAGCRVFTIFHSNPGYDVDVIWGDLIARKKAKSAGSIKRFIPSALRFNKYHKRIRESQSVRHRAQIEASDKLVLLSDRFKDTFMSNYNMPAKYADKLCAVSNPLRFAYLPAADHLANKEKEVLMVARLNEAQKRMSLALKVWAIVERSGLFPDWRFSLVGHGPQQEWDECQRQIRELGIERVSMEGRQDSEPYFHRASILVLTSRFEGFGMVLTEAMQNGVVPVAMDSFEALHDIVTDGRNGFIVPDGGVDGFAARVMELMSDKAMRERMALNAVKDIGKFSVGNIVDRWEEILRP